MKRFMKYGFVPFMLMVLAAASVSGAENEIDSLLKRMKDPKFEVRKQAIYYDLRTKHGEDPRLIPALFDVIETDPELKIKIMALDKLELYTKYDAVVEKLIRLTDHETPEIREHAIRSLCGYGGIQKMSNTIAIRKVYPLFIKILKDPDRTEYFHIRAVRGLGELRDKQVMTKSMKSETLTLLCDALKTGDRFLRISASEVIGKFWEARSSLVPILCEVLKDPEFRVRENAAKTLASYYRSIMRKKKKDTRAIQPAIDALAIEDAGYVKKELIRMLAYTKDPSALPVLVKSAFDKSESVRKEAAKALKEIDKSKAFVHVASIYEKGDDVEKEQAAWAMGYLKNNRAIDILIKSLDGGEKLRRAAAWSLAQIGGSKSNQIFDTAMENQTLDLIAWGCDYYIRRGKAGSEDMIIQALQQHGDKITAVSMLNSGNKKLYQAAEKWAKKKGYSLVGRSYLTFGPTSSAWGSKRK
jgi:HEAT repeat protein